MIYYACTMPKVTIIFGDETKTIEVEKGGKLLKIGLDAGFPIEHACGGNGFCTTCMCEVTEGADNISELNDREENMGITGEPERLTCQAKVEGDCTVRILNA